MFLASSEMAVAMSVASPDEKPSSSARDRPFWRAKTMSWSELMVTRISIRDTESSLSLHGFELLVQISQTFLQIEGCGDTFQSQTELDHCECDFGLNSDDDSFRAAQADHVGNFPQRARGEGVHDVHGGDIHDDTARTEPHDLLHKSAAQLVEVGIGEGGLKRRDEDGPLFKNRNFHVALFPRVSSLAQLAPLLCIRSNVRPVQC